MKLTFLMMFIFCMQVSAKVYSQKDVKLSLNLEGVKLSKVLTTIEKKTDFRFLYNDREVSANKRLDVKADNTPLTDILSRMLLNTGLNYKILENNLIIIAPENTLSQEITVKGKVTDSLGHPLPGVTVKVEGANRGTTTDANGEYSITVPDNGRLVFSFIGYENQVV
ncbi:MAG TPA: carboxypeptidase-like regulatory domain-containing protein, partial [Chitinophagaceae bacterium]